MPDQPKIPLATTAVVLNDMINMNLVSSDPATQQIIDDSKIVENTANLIAERPLSLVPLCQPQTHEICRRG